MDNLLAIAPCPKDMPTRLKRLRDQRLIIDYPSRYIPWTTGDFWQGSAPLASFPETDAQTLTLLLLQPAPYRQPHFGPPIPGSGQASSPKEVRRGQSKTMTRPHPAQLTGIHDESLQTPMP
jgi:hypothetical protein